MLHLRKADPGYNRLPDVQQMTLPPLADRVCGNGTHTIGGQDDRLPLKTICLADP